MDRSIGHSTGLRTWIGLDWGGGRTRTCSLLIAVAAKGVFDFVHEARHLGLGGVVIILE